MLKQLILFTILADVFLAPWDLASTQRLGAVLLAACPLVIAALTPLEIRVVAVGLSPVVPSGLTMEALKSTWVLQPVFAGFSSCRSPGCGSTSRRCSPSRHSLTRGKPDRPVSRGSAP